MNIFRLFWIGLLGIVEILDLCANGAFASPAEIRIAFVGTPTRAVNLLFVNDYYKKEVLKDYGTAYTVILNKVTATPIAGQLFAGGQVDIATLSAPVLSSLIKQGILRADDISIIGPGVTDGFSGHTKASNFWASLKSSGINSPKDLRGKTIALNGFGTNSDAALRMVLLREKLDPNKDVKLVEIPFPNQQAALEQRRADVAMFSTPFTEQVRSTNNITELFSFIEIFGGPTYNTVLVIRKSTAAKMDGPIKAFLADFVTGLHWIQTPANREKAVELAAETLNLPKDRLASVYLTEADEGIDPNLCVQAKWLQTPLQQLVNTGVVTEAVDLSSTINPSLLPAGGAACK